MRGRKPRPLSVARADNSRLKEIARCCCLPWYQVRRARIVLARVAGDRTRDIAQQIQCNVRTVQRTCRRYEQLGLAGLLTQAHRRSEEHTSELQSHSDLVCRLLLEKKKKQTQTRTTAV